MRRRAGPVTVTGAALSPDDPHVLKLTLDREFAPGETVKVSYRRPAGEARTVGTWTARSSGTSDWAMTIPSPPPAATGVSISPTPTAGDTYVPGETIRVAVAFDQAVDIGGTPRIELDIDPAAGAGGGVGRAAARRT